jgi:hypothetical protein
MWVGIGKPFIYLGHRGCIEVHYTGYGGYPMGEHHYKNIDQTAIPNQSQQADAKAVVLKKVV